MASQLWIALRSCLKPKPAFTLAPSSTNQLSAICKPQNQKSPRQSSTPNPMPSKKILWASNLFQSSFAFSHHDQDKRWSGCSHFLKDKKKTRRLFSWFQIPRMYLRCTGHTRRKIFTWVEIQHDVMWCDQATASLTPLKIFSISDRHGIFWNTIAFSMPLPSGPLGFHRHDFN